MTDYLAYKGSFVRVSVRELNPDHFVWEYQINGGQVYEDRDRPLPVAAMAFRRALSAAMDCIDQTQG